MSFMDNIKSGVDSAIDALNPVFDFGYDIYRKWLTAAGTKTMTGNRTIIKIGGKAVGLVQHININCRIDQQPLHGIGDVLPAEIVPGHVEYSVEGNRALVPKKSLTAMGILPDDDSWLTAPSLELELIDRVSGNNVLVYGCKLTNYRIEAKAHAIVLEHFNMTARGMQRVKWGK